MAMSQPKVQAPYVPGQKEPVDLVRDVEERGSSGSSGGKSGSGKGVGFLGSGGDGEGKDGREKQQGDYYTPVGTEVVDKGSSKGKPSEGLDGIREGAEMNDLYSPEAGVDIATTDKQSIPENKTRTAAGGSEEQDANKGMAGEVGDALGVVKGRVMDRLAGLQLPSESLEAVRRTFETSVKGAYATTRDAVQRTRQSLLDLFPSSLTSSPATEARKVVEEMEKEMLANSEGSGEDMSQISEGPKAIDAAKASPESFRSQFRRAKL